MYLLLRFKPAGFEVIQTYTVLNGVSSKKFRLFFYNARGRRAPASLRPGWICQRATKEDRVIKKDSARVQVREAFTPWNTRAQKPFEFSTPRRLG